MEFRSKCKSLSESNIYIIIRIEQLYYDLFNMGITLQEYRISIGTYSNSGLPKFGNKNREMTYKDKQDARIEWINKRLLYTLLVCFLVHFSLNAALLTNLTDERSHFMDANQMKVVTKTCLKTFPQKLQERFGLRNEQRKRRKKEQKKKYV